MDEEIFVNIRVDLFAKQRNRLRGKDVTSVLKSRNAPSRRYTTSVIECVVASC